MRLATHTKTLWGLMVGFLLLYWWWDHVWLLYIGIALGVIGLVSKRLSLWIARGWMALARAIGKVNSILLLGLIFFLVLTPLALFTRLFRRDPLRLKDGDSSAYVHRKQVFSKSNLEDPW